MSASTIVEVPQAIGVIRNCIIPFCPLEIPCICIAWIKV